VPDPVVAVIGGTHPGPRPAVRVLVLPARLPDHDSWLFDDSAGVKLLYRPDGTQIGRELVEDPDLGAYLSSRDATWADAAPFRDYWEDTPASRV
jgi:hypothetical protein